MKEALSASETSVLTTATRRNIPENVIFLKIYIHTVPVTAVSLPRGLCQQVLRSKFCNSFTIPKQATCHVHLKSGTDQTNNICQIVKLSP
jgi:hypothetical protein